MVNTIEVRRTPTRSTSAASFILFFTRRLRRKRRQRRGAPFINRGKRGKRRDSDAPENPRRKNTVHFYKFTTNGFAHVNFRVFRVFRGEIKGAPLRCLSFPRNLRVKKYERNSSGLNEERSQLRPQCLERPTHLRFHRLHRNPEHFRDSGITQTVLTAHHKDHTAPLR